MSATEPGDLQRIYAARFQGDLEYRRAVWRVLITDFFQAYVRSADTVLDLGCGYGQFINQVRCAHKLAMDLNPQAREHLTPEVKLLLQDCSAPWALPDQALDVVFTSNFFEHLPDKAALGRTLDEARRCLKPGGRLLALGPNIKHLPGAYWRFWDHHLPLTEDALNETLRTRGFHVELCLGKFLPYTMVAGPRYPLICVRLYLRLRLAWHVFGKQFLVIGQKAA